MTALTNDTGKKTSVAAISVLASGSLALAKLVVGIAIGSLALISEALHSSIDLVATSITWAVVRVSDQPADAEHHYGHGKFESLSALGVTALLYLLAGGILVEAWSRLREGAPPPTISAVPFVVLVIDIVVNYWRARALHRAARETRSQALEADALHFTSDMLGSFAVIAGLILAGLGFWWGDAAAAIAVAVMIGLLGLKMTRATVETLLDRAPEGIAEKAEAAIRAVPGVVDVERMRVRMVGPTYFIDSIAKVPRTYPIDREARQRLPDPRDDEEYGHQRPGLGKAQAEGRHQPRKERRQDQVEEMRGGVREPHEGYHLGIVPVRTGGGCGIHGRVHYHSSTPARRRRAEKETPARCERGLQPHDARVTREPPRRCGRTRSRCLSRRPGPCPSVRTALRGSAWRADSRSPAGSRA